MNAENCAKDFIAPKGFNVGKWFLETPLPLSTGAKWTYVVLAICACGDNHAWPDMEYLVKKVSASSRTIRRYLDELVRHGFIVISNEKSMGKKRAIYRFLNHAVLSSENAQEWERKAEKKAVADTAESDATAFDFDQWEKMVEQHEKESAKLQAEQAAWAEEAKNSSGFQSANVTNCPGICDKNDTALYKVESYDLEIPPISPTTEDLSTNPTGTPVSEVSGKVGGEETPNKEIRSEDQAWAKTKRLLAERMREVDLKAYIEPCEFERAESVAVLRFPNEFAMRHVRRTFGDELREAFGDELREAFMQAGFKDFCLAVMTDEQKERYNREMNEREKAARAEAAQIRAALRKKDPEVPEDFDFGAIAPLELFEKLYERYPRKERKRKSFDVFERMARSKMFPPMPVLLAAVKRQSENPKWQREEGRYVPQLHRWLSEQRWED